MASSMDTARVTCIGENKGTVNRLLRFFALGEVRLRVPAASVWAFLWWTAAQAGPAYAEPFGFQDVVEKAERLAAQPYKPPQQVPGALRDLAYDEFRSIRFDPEHSLWRQSDSRFQAMLIAPGKFFTHAVRLNQVDGEEVHPVVFDKSAFTFGSQAIADKVPEDLGYAGFTLTYPLHDETVQDQFLSFAGASYFRGVGEENAFGISARGAAIDTGVMSGEEFPSFVEYWLVRPDPEAASMQIYALLDSRRLAGAYRFTIRPGQPTEVDIEAVLFTRERMELLGIAPLTSMYFYGENTGRPLGNWRPEVHDSDGLLIHDGSGEWVWRPLINPRALEVHSFQVRDVKGFGLMQRDEQFAAYQDPEAHYERRPSAWVEFEEGLETGRIVLIQIPTKDETNDNIVAFWSPPGEVKGGQRLDFRYRLDFGNAAGLAAHEPARVLHTFVGRGDIMGGGNVENAYRFVIDFDAESLPRGDDESPGTQISAGAGEVVDYHVQFVEAVGAWRLSILARPAQPGGAVSLRAALKSGEEFLSETWDYHLPGNNSIRGGER